MKKHFYNLSNVKNLFIEYHGTFHQYAELTKIFQIVTREGFSYYIKEALNIYKSPFLQTKDPKVPFDVQLNIFCFRA